MSFIRRTADGFELTHRTIRSGIGVAVFVIGAVALALRKNDKIDGAVQTKTFVDTTLALRRDVRAIALSVERIGNQSLSLNCYIAKYPVGLCDNVPRPGAPARSEP